MGKNTATAAIERIDQCLASLTSSEAAFNQGGDLISIVLSNFPVAEVIASAVRSSSKRAVCPGRIPMFEVVGEP